MANELRVLASISVDLGSTADQPIDMSAYGRYVVLGYALTDLASAIPSGSTKVSIKTAGGTSISDVTLTASFPLGAGDGLSALPAGTQQQHVQTGDLHAVVSLTTRTGNSVTYNILGVELP